jgi:hypothetical protein
MTRHFMIPVDVTITPERHQKPKVTSSRIIHTARCLVVMLEVVYVRQGDARARVPMVRLSVGDSCVGFSWKTLTFARAKTWRRRRLRHVWHQ